MTAFRARPSLRAAIVFGLAAALWFASTMGLLHGTLHGHGVHRSAVPAAAAVLPAHALSTVVAIDIGAADAAGLFDALFGNHVAGDAQCQLYDQLSGGHALPSIPQIVLPLALPMAAFHFLEGEFVARWVALFDARGPPDAR